MLEETPYLNLTTRGRKTGLKHDVELWFAFEDGKLYFLAHESSHWWKNVVKTPRKMVRWREIKAEGGRDTAWTGPGKEAKRQR